MTLEEDNDDVQLNIDIAVAYNTRTAFDLLKRYRSEGGSSLQSSYTRFSKHTIRCKKQKAKEEPLLAENNIHARLSAV